MPPVSEAQRRAMRAAAAGKSTLGIPKSVGQDFSQADPGGKLPQRKQAGGGVGNYLAGVGAGLGQIPKDVGQFASDVGTALNPFASDLGQVRGASQNVREALTGGVAPFVTGGFTFPGMLHLPEDYPSSWQNPPYSSTWARLHYQRQGDALEALRKSFLDPETGEPKELSFDQFKLGPPQKYPTSTPGYEDWERDRQFDPPQELGARTPASDYSEVENLHRIVQDYPKTSAFAENLGTNLPRVFSQTSDALRAELEAKGFQGFKHGGGIGLGARPRLQGGGFGDIGRMTSADMPYWTRAEARIDDQPFGGGLIPSSGAGRTDQLPLAVATESHVIPAAEMAGIGQGNTLAGAAILSRALTIGPWGSRPLPAVHGHGPPAPPAFRFPRPPGLAPEEPYIYRQAGGDIRPTLQGAGAHSEGGAKHQTSILAAGGEFVIPREDWLQYDHDGELQLHAGVRSIGEGDINKGHERLNQMIMNIRKHNIKFLRNAPPPKS